MKFIINQKLPSLNDYILACRTNKYAGGKFKSNVETDILNYIYVAKLKREIHSIDKPFYISFEWHERTKKRDPDNIASAKKFILDALQKSGIIINDNQKYVKGFSDKFDNDTRDYVVVEIKEWKNE